MDGAEVWHQRGVTTNHPIGLADIVRIPLAVAHASTVEVRVSGDGRRTRSVTSRASDASRLRCDLDPAGNMSIGPAPGGTVFRPTHDLVVLSAPTLVAGRRHCQRRGRARAAARGARDQSCAGATPRSAPEAFAALLARQHREWSSSQWQISTRGSRLPARGSAAQTRCGRQLADRWERRMPAGSRVDCPATTSRRCGGQLRRPLPISGSPEQPWVHRSADRTTW